MEHAPSCNCEDCWWAHNQHVVDEFGVPIIDNNESKIGDKLKGVDTMTVYDYLVKLNKKTREELDKIAESLHINYMEYKHRADLCLKIAYKQKDNENKKNEIVKEGE